MKQETREKLSRTLKEKWASGTRRPNPKEARERAAATLRARFASGDLKPSQMPLETRIRCGEMMSQRYSGRTLRKSPISEYEKEQIRAVGEQFRKTDPRAQKGPNNQCARVWRLRSPVNKIYEFINLRHFIRENQSLFLPEDVEWHAKTKRETDTTCKAHGGLSMLSPRRKQTAGSWKGWTWVSHIESIYNNKEDLLSRSNKVLTNTNLPNTNNKTT